MIGVTIHEVLLCGDTIVVEPSSLAVCVAILAFVHCRGMEESVSEERRRHCDDLLAEIGKWREEDVTVLGAEGEV